MYWGRNWIKAPLLICSPASAFRFLLVFSIRVEPGGLLVSCFNPKTYQVLLKLLH